MGGNGNLEGVAKRFVSSFLRAVPTSLTMFGGGTWEGGSCEEKDADFAGKPGSPLNGTWDRKEREPGERRQALCLICSPGSANFMNHVWGRDMGRREL